MRAVVVPPLQGRLNRSNCSPGASMLMMTLVLPLHGSLPNSGRESPRLRPEPGHSMIRR